ncbi:MAG: metal-dependent transcriptional regulator [Nitrososphaerota archaeon]|nr:metal-dependent transcriptional regulator [Nitrososphaerota archaeon]
MRQEETSGSVGEYLRALALLSSAGREEVSTGSLSRYLGVAPASATEMLEKLTGEGYVSHSPYRGAVLTSKGVREAQRVTRKHRLLERFLSDVLHIPVEGVHSQACAMEHSLSDEAEEAICRLLNHPNWCPDDGQVIPACDLPFADCDACMKSDPQEAGHVKRRMNSLFPMSGLGAGARGTVSFIRGGADLVRELRRAGLAPGVRVTVEEGGRQDETVTVSVKGSKITVGPSTAASVFVAVDNRRK